MSKLSKRSRHTLLESTINETKLNISESGHYIFQKTSSFTMPALPFSRLYYIIDGELNIIVNKKTVCLKKNHVYLLPPNTTFSRLEGKYVQQLYFHINLYNTEGWDILNNYTYCDGFKADYIPEMLTMYYSKNTIDLLTIKQTILSDCINFLKKSEVNLISKSYSNIIKKAMEYIRNNLSIKLTVQEVANFLSVSPTTLNHHFKKEINMPVSKYIHELILNRARTLLVNPNLSIREISEELGYYDQFHFSRKFKERYEQSPLTFRKNNTEI